MAAGITSSTTVELLLKKGMDIEVQDTWLQTPLHWTMKALRKEIGTSRIVQQLLEVGADVNAQGGEYDNALKAA